MYQLAQQMFPGYPDPLPSFQYLGESGRGLLLSGLAQPAQTFEGRFLYRTVFDKAAILLFSLIKNHPFKDGNKRMGFTAAATFLTLNGYVFYAEQRETVKMCVYIAHEAKVEELGVISRWLRIHAVSLAQYNRMDSTQKLRWLTTSVKSPDSQRQLVGMLDGIWQNTDSDD